MPFTGFDHPAIGCRDVRAMAAWYCDRLGMRVVADNGQDPPAVLVGYGDGVTFELMPARDPGPAPAGQPRFAPGLRHVALRVSDFDAAYDALRAAGVTFVGDPGPALGGGRIAGFRDPEGNELQIVQRPASDF